MDRLERALNRLAMALAIVGGLGLGAAVLMTCWSALGKFGLRQLHAVFGAGDVPTFLGWLRPISGEDELVAFLVGFGLFAALPLVTLKREHITINLFRPVFGPWGNQLLDAIAAAVLAVLSVLLVQQQWNLLFKPARTSRGQEPLLNHILAGDWATVSKRFIDNKETQVMGLDFWPLHIWAEVCALVFCLMAFFVLAKSIGALVTRQKGPRE